MFTRVYTYVWLGSRVVSVLDSGAEGPGSIAVANRATQIDYTNNLMHFAGSRVLSLSKPTQRGDDVIDDVTDGGPRDSKTDAGDVRYCYSYAYLLRLFA